MIRSIKNLPITLFFAAAIALGCLISTTIQAQELAEADQIEVIYQGLLQDESGAPVSGLFPLKFSVYRGSSSAKPLWEEQHFVSIIDGKYAVSLGLKQPLGEFLLAGERWIGIELAGEGELLRDRLVVELAGGAGPAQARSASTDGSHARSADFATEAERARTADNALALDGMSAEKIEELANLALKRLGEHMADPEAHASSARYRIGTERRPMERIGGSGGTPYDIRCPAGYVVTGIEGRAGRLLDSITVVCSPLQ